MHFSYFQIKPYSTSVANISNQGSGSGLRLAGSGKTDPDPQI